MTVLKAENWDGVTAPAIPAGWTVDTVLKTSTAFSPTSAPNSLAYATADINAALVPFATWATQDTNNGDVQVSAIVRLSPTGASAEQDIFLFARSPIVRASANVGTATYYFAEIQRGITTPIVKLTSVLNGVGTDIGSVTVTLADNTNYTLYLICHGTTISAELQRMSDSLWLNPSGSFVSGETPYATGTDANITGPGYTGIGTYLGAAAGSISTDDFTLQTYPIVTPPPPSTDTFPAVKVFYGGMPQ